MTRLGLLIISLSWAINVFGGESAEFKAAYRAGRAEAQRDISRNYLAVEEYGKVSGWDADYAKIAEKRFGVHVKRVAGCIILDQILGHAKGYNEISEPEIKRRFGRDVLMEARIAASGASEKTRHK